MEKVCLGFKEPIEKILWVLKMIASTTKITPGMILDVTKINQFDYLNSFSVRQCML